MKKNLFFIAGLLLSVIGLIIFASYSPVFNAQNTQSTTTQLKIKNASFQVEVAKTPAQQTKGLSGRSNLEDNGGMLFVFDQPARHQFWMKNTLIPLDIIWIDENKKIVDYYQNAQPEPGVPDAQLKRYTPSTEALYALELKGGSISQHQIQIGDIVQFSLEE